MQIKISNTFSSFGYAELIFDESGIVKYEHTNLRYENLTPVFNQITGGAGTRAKRINTSFVNEWDVILANVEWYNKIGYDEQNRLFGTYRGNPEHDEWAEFHQAPNVSILSATNQAA